MPWTTYLQYGFPHLNISFTFVLVKLGHFRSQMIGEDDFHFITEFLNASGEKRDVLLQNQRVQCAKTFLSLLEHISKDQTIQYILTTIDDMLQVDTLLNLASMGSSYQLIPHRTVFLQEDKGRVEIFREYAKKKRENVWSPFLNLLNRPDGFIQNMTARIIAKLACWSREPMDGTDLNFYLSWLKHQLQTPGNEYIQSTARCLQMMLRDEKYRLAFANMEGVLVLANVLSSRINFQVLIFHNIHPFVGLLKICMCAQSVTTVLPLRFRSNINWPSAFGS